MSLNFIPDYRFETFDQATAEFLKKIGVKGVILDIDNTLEPYEHSDPGEHVVKWLNSLKEAGIKTAIVSNNNKERVERFNKNLNMPIYFKAGKPFKKNICLAMKDLGTDRNTTVFMGDQVFTDVWGAHNASIKAILVPPINDKRDLFTKFKRLLERPFLKIYNKRNKIKEN